MDDKLQRLTKKGQWIGDVPKDRSVEFLQLFKDNFPDRDFALIGDGQVSLIVYPPLTKNELEAWEHICDERLQQAASAPSS